MSCTGVGLKDLKNSGKAAYFTRAIKHLPGSGVGLWPARSEGQTLVEFAMVALLLMMLLVGIVDVSRLMLTYTTIANAARAGTRYAIVHGTTQTGNCGDATTYIKAYLSAAAMSTASSALTITAPACASAGSTVTTSVSYKYVPLTAYFWSTSITLSSTSKGVVVF